MAPGGVTVVTVRGAGPPGGVQVVVRGPDPGLPRALTGPGLDRALHLILAPYLCRLDPGPAVICWGRVGCGAFNTPLC